MIETEKDYHHALNRVADLLDDPKDHTRVINSLAKKISDYEAKVKREHDIRKEHDNDRNV